MAKREAYYNSLNAFKNKEVYIELPTVFYSCNFDVALANAYYIGSVFYKEEFKDFNIKTKFNEIMNFLLGVDVYDDMVNYVGCEYGKLIK